MGQTLDKPIVEKQVEKGKGNGLSHGVCSMQGWRLDMEDAHTALPCLSDAYSSCSYYAVFDGHAGSYTSGICSQRLHDAVLKNLSDNNVDITVETFDDETSDLINKIIRDAFVDFDDNLKVSAPYKNLQESCGTTAVCVLVTPHHIIFCNCGDSRGFLSRDNSVLFQTKDHKPSDIVEKTRIEESGGSVVMDRVNGNLAVSRAIGDFSFKDKLNLDSRNQAVSPEPTVTILKRNNDDFIVLACDGIWDVMSCEEVRNFVYCRMKVTSDLSVISAELIDYCLMKDSRDNMSVIIISMENAPKVCEIELEQEKIYNAQLEKYVLEYIEGSSTGVTLLNTLQALSTRELHPCLSSKLGIFAKTRFIEAIIDNNAPKRSKERDYSSGNFLSNFPMAMQAIQSLVRQEGPADSENNQNDESSDACEDENDPTDNSFP